MERFISYGVLMLKQFSKLVTFWQQGTSFKEELGLTRSMELYYSDKYFVLLRDDNEDSLWINRENGAFSTKAGPNK